METKDKLKVTLLTHQNEVIREFISPQIMYHGHGFWIYEEGKEDPTVLDKTGYGKILLEKVAHDVHPDL